MKRRLMEILACPLDKHYPLELHVFEDVSSTGLTAALSIEHSQAQQIRIVRGGYGANGYGTLCQYGITTALGDGGGGGSFHCENVQFGYNSVCDIFPGAPNHAIYIEGGESEDSAAFLLFTVPGSPRNSSGDWCVTVRNFTWMGNMLATDGVMVNWAHNAGLKLDSCQLGDGSKPGALKISAGVPTSTGLVENCMIYSSLPDPFTGNGKWKVRSSKLNGQPFSDQ